MASEKYVKFTFDYIREEIVKKEHWQASKMNPIWGDCPTRVLLLYGGNLGGMNYYLDPYNALMPAARAIVLYHGKRTGLPAYHQWSKAVVGQVVYYLEYDRRHIVKVERETFMNTVGVRGRDFQRAISGTIHSLYYPGSTLGFLNKISTSRVVVESGHYKFPSPTVPRPYPGDCAGESSSARSADFARLQAEYERHIARLRSNPEP